LEHQFAVGQIVALAPSRFQAAAAGDYEILRLMPASDVSTDSPRYRVKSVNERHERVVRESELTLSMKGSPREAQPAERISLPAIEP